MKYDLTDFLNHIAWSDTRTIGSKKCSRDDCNICH